MNTCDLVLRMLVAAGMKEVFGIPGEAFGFGLSKLRGIFEQLGDSISPSS